MKNGICPKCGSGHIHSGAHIFPKSGPFASNAIPVNLSTLAPLDNFVCTDCGYLESYVANEKLRRVIEDKWPRVPTAAVAQSD
ncbi:MAG: hypothetical protein PVH30_05315 [Desulfobacterales bacterium]